MSGTIWDIDPCTSSQRQDTDSQSLEAEIDHSIAGSLGSHACKGSFYRNPNTTEPSIDPSSITTFINSIRNTQKDDYDPFWK